MTTPLLDPASRWLERIARTLAISVALAAAGCGGVGEEGTGVRTESANVGVLSGVSDTSVTVNGVEYRRQAATVTDGVGQPLDSGDLRIGMWVEVNGTAALDGSDAAADKIRVRAAARGEIQSIAQDGTVTVLDSPVTLGVDTVLDTGADASALAPGDLIEVHGPLGAASGAVVASRVERLASTPNVALPYVLRGRVSQLQANAKTMTVAGRQVDYRSATVMLGLGLKNGQIVRVSSRNAPVDGLPWAIDDLRSDVTLPANLGFLYTEGFVDQWQSGPSFLIEDLKVDASAANGKTTVNADGQQVAVFGPRIGGTLKAKSVTVVQPGAPVVFTLVGPISNFNPLTSQFRVRGVLVDAGLATFVPLSAQASLADGVRVRVEGTVRGRGLLLSKVVLAPLPSP